MGEKRMGNGSGGGRLYVSDLDHTLLQQDGALSAGARGRLERMLGEGLPFTVASARSIVSIREILGDLPLSLPVVHYNGGFVSDWGDGGRHWFIESFGREMGERMLEAIARHGAQAMISTHDGEETWIFHAGAGNAGMEWYLETRRVAKDDRPRQVAALAEALAHPVVAITAIDTRERLEPLAAELEAAFAGEAHTHFYLNQYNPPWHWLSIYPAGATKAAALERLIGALGVRAEDVTVFGDGDNDIPMFRLAGRAVAVENATELLKAEADLVIGPNTEDSVVGFIEREWMGKRIE